MSSRIGGSLLERLRRVDDRAGVSLEAQWERNDGPASMQLWAMANRRTFALAVAACLIVSSVVVGLATELTVESFLVSVILGVISAVMVGPWTYFAVGRLSERYDAWRLQSRVSHTIEDD